MHPTKWLALILLWSVTLPSQSQEGTAVWKRSEQSDAFSGAQYSQFVLVGRYLTPPHNAQTAPPALILKCHDREHSVGYHVFRSGDRLASYLSIGAVLNRSAQGVPVMYRLDDGKPQTEQWSVSTDGLSAFFGETTLNNLIYGHIVAHKDNSSPPVRKVVIAMDEAFATRIVMQFDMPDASAISDSCGMTIHKR
jgi:hypothetical protein